MNRFQFNFLYYLVTDFNQRYANGFRFNSLCMRVSFNIYTLPTIFVETT